MAEQASRVLENEEELNVMEGRKPDYKDKVQSSDGGKAKEQRARRENCFVSLGSGKSTREVPEMHQSCTGDAPYMHQSCTRYGPRMQRSCARNSPECGRCTTCQLHITMAAIVNLQNQLFRGSRSHGL